jgi:hypothetical protein
MPHAPCSERSEPGRRILQGRVGFLHTLSSRTRESIDQCYLLLNFFLNFLSSLTAPEPCEAGWHRSGSPVWSDRESGMRGVWAIRLRTRPRRRWILGRGWCMCIGLVAHTPVQKTTDHGPRTIYRDAGFFRIGVVGESPFQPL